MTTTPTIFLAPIGGFPSSADVVPTIIFLVLYSLLVPICLFRAISPKTRNVVQLPITATIVERILNLVVRLLQAKGKWSPRNAALIEYQQITLGWGWIALVHAMLAFWRSVAVNTTRSDIERGFMDERSMRKRLKLASYILEAGFWLAQMLGVGAGIFWRVSFEGGVEAYRKSMVLGYFNIVLAMVLTFISIAGVYWLRRNLRGINQTACSYLMTLYSLVLIVPIYRLTHYALQTSIRPLFYTFHLAPEYIIAAILITTDTRKLFGTGAWGDCYWSWKKGWRIPYRPYKASRPLVVDAARRWSQQSEAESDETESLIPRSDEGHSPIQVPPRAIPRRDPAPLPVQPIRWLWSRLDSEPPQMRAVSPALIHDSHPASCF